MKSVLLLYLMLEGSVVDYQYIKDFKSDWACLNYLEKSQSVPKKMTLYMEYYKNNKKKITKAHQLKLKCVEGIRIA